MTETTTATETARSAAAAGPGTDEPPRPPTVPAFCLVLLVGASGSGKTTYAAANFARGEVVSSDACREQVGDGEADGDATPAAFELLEKVVDLRLRGRRLCAVDATNLRSEDRARLLALARAHHALTAAIVLDPGEAACRARVAARGRGPAPAAVAGQHGLLRRAMGELRREGHAYVHVLDAAGAGLPLARTRLWTDREDEAGPFDVVGDVHGCLGELLELLGRLGWEVFPPGQRPRARHPGGRKLAFVGDLVDRGPDVGGVLELVMDLVEDGLALCVAGNHEAKVEQWLRGRKVKPDHGLPATTGAVEARGRDFRERLRRFLGRLVSHYMLDGGRLAVAHAGIPAEMQGRASGAVRAFCLYGPTTGRTGPDGLPERGAWVPGYRGACKVVYGHTPVARAEWVNNTLCLDTGCVFGGSLTALRYPEMDIVSVPAARTYVEPSRPFIDPGGRTAQQAEDRDLDVADLLGKRAVETGLMRRLTVREGQALDALGSLARHAVDPRWLVYLPPTMAPCAGASEPGYLEHPREAFAQYRRDGLDRVVAEEKHMGSRATLALCRGPEAAAARFGIEDGSVGEAWTRTGRPFFEDPARRDAFLARAVAGAEAAGLFDLLGSDWAVLDAEIMPWSEKAMGLVRGLYAPVASAGRAGLGMAIAAMDAAAARGIDLSGPAAEARARLAAVEGFAAEVRRHAPPADTGAVRVAAFHVLASEGRVHHDRDHLWHLAMGRRLADADPLFQATRHHVVDLADPGSEAAATRAWVEATEAGSEGFVVKPLGFLVRSGRGLVQPAVKCRGRPYLSIVYGPGYDAPGNLERLRQRALATKRSLAMREFALGIEGLERFVRREPLRRVHECAFGVLALESEAVDPRL